VSDTDPRVELLRDAYDRFNGRDVESLLEYMTDDIEWPDVAQQTVLHGKEPIRAYWRAQFAATDPRVTPVEFVPVGDEVVAVVEQQVLTHDGQILVPLTVVYHRYRFAGRLVRRMDVYTEREHALRA
jgi:ketosteroid isomerase-like protein